MPIGLLISAIVVGSLYAMASMAIVIVYKSCKIVNFALGGSASLSVYMAYSASGYHWPYVLLLAVALVAGMITGAITELVLRLLGAANHLSYIVATFALFLVTQGVILWHWGSEFEAVPSPWSLVSGWKVGGTLISYNDLIAVAIAAVVTFGLHMLIQHTRFGMAIRMASSGPLTARLMGVKVTRVRFWTWVIGGGIGGVTALLFTPTTSLDAFGFTSFMMIALVALVIGGFTSIRGAAAGGLILGIVLTILSYELNPNLTQTYLFLIVAALLFIRPNGLLGVRDAAVPEPVIASARFQKMQLRVKARRDVDRAPHPDHGHGRAAAAPRRTGARRALPALGIGVALLLVLPFIAPITLLNLLPFFTATYISVLGLNVLVGYSGQLSVGQNAMMAVGAYSGAIVAAHVGGSPLLTLPIGLIAGLIVGVIVGLPAVRLGPLFLVLFTLTFSFSMPELLSSGGNLTGGTAGLAFPHMASLFASRNQYWVGLGIAALCTAGVYVMRRMEFGRRWTAVRDSPAGAQSVGLNPAFVKISAFSVASGLGALGGVLSGFFTGFISPTDFSPLLSITLLVAVVVGGAGSIVGSIVGAALLIVVTAYAPNIGLPADLILGLVLLIVLVASPAGFVDLARRGYFRIVSAVASRLRPGAVSRPTRDRLVPIAVTKDTRPVAGLQMNEASRPVYPVEPRPKEGWLLEIRDLEAGYGQAKALLGVSLCLKAGSATALVGSNGAGKTTLLRVISGLVRPTSGDVLFDGRSVVGVIPSDLARMGISHMPEGRGIFPDLTVRENLAASIFAHPDERRAQIDEALAVFPALKSMLGRHAGTLSGGEQQMLAVGRALLTKPRLLLLDEPTLGLSPLIAKNLMSSLEVVRGTGLTVLLVEQNVRAAMQFADSAYVMSGGEVVAQGPSEELLGREDILATYLGITL